MKKVKFVQAGYFHSNHRYMYRYVDSEGKKYDLFESEVHQFLNGDDDNDWACVSPNFLDLFLLREVGKFNPVTKRWDWVYE